MWHTILRMNFGKLFFFILLIIASGCGLGTPEPSARTRALGDLGGDADVQKTDTDVTDEDFPGDEDDGDDDPAPGDDDDPTPVDGSPCPATGACRIMPLGDSITDGHGWPGGYRIKLWQYFQTNGKSVDFVGSLSNGPASLGDTHHEGHSGWTIDEITDIAAARVTTHQPHIVLLHIGTNDIFGPPVNLIPKLEALLDVIATTRPTTHIIVSSLFPLTPTWNSNQRLEVYNADIPGLVAAKAALGRPISFVDIYSAVSQSDLSDDKIHPSLTGYDKMAGVWWGALAPMLP